VVSPIPRILIWSRRHRAVVIAGALCLAALSAAGVRRLSFDTDVLSLLPRDGRVIPAFRTFVEQFGSLDQLYVVFTAPEGHSISDYEAQVDDWIKRLRQSPAFSRVDSGLADGSRDLTWLADRQLLLLRDEGMQAALARLRGDSMREALASRRELLALPSPAIAEIVRRDPLGLYDLLREQLGGQSGINLGVTEGGYVTSDGRRRLVIALPARPPYDTGFSHALFAALENARRDMSAQPAGSIEDEPLPPLQVDFAGGHRIALETEALVRRESIVNGVGSLALILPLLFFVFRSVWLVAVGPLPSSVSLLIVLGLLGLAGATLSAAATASAAMLFGLGIDGVVLLYVAYTLALRDGADPVSAVDRLGGRAASMLLGMATTAATFYGLAFVDFPSLRQLGMLIGHSMVLCGIFTLFLVPALLPRRPPRLSRPLTMPGLASWIERRRVAILTVAAIATVALGIASMRVRISPTLDRLRSVTAGAVFLERIGAEFGLPADVYVVLQRGGDLDELLARNERFVERAGEALPALRVQAASALLPSREVQMRRAAAVQHAGLSAAQVQHTLVSAAHAEGFRDDTFAPFVERLPNLLAHDHYLSHEGYVTHGLGDVIGRFVARDSDGWLLASYLFPAADQIEGLQKIVAETGGTTTLTGLPLVNRELAERFLPQFLKGLAIGTAVVLVMIVATFRDWRLSILSLAPVGMGLVWAAGLLALARVELDLFALFAVVTFVGIGVDYGVHLVHRHRELGEARRAIEELAPVILVAAGITVLGYGTLIASSYPPLRSIGMVSIVAVATLAAASVIVLPAMLVRSR
jgi:uncharacterized protein